jgi:hypothetical protein
VPPSLIHERLLQVLEIVAELEVVAAEPDVAVVKEVALFGEGVYAFVDGVGAMPIPLPDDNGYGDREQDPLHKDNYGSRNHLKLFC